MLPAFCGVLHPRYLKNREAWRMFSHALPSPCRVIGNYTRVFPAEDRHSSRLCAGPFTGASAAVTAPRGRVSELARWWLRGGSLTGRPTGH